MRQKVEALTNSLAEQQRVVNKLTQYYNSLDQLSKKECQCPAQHCKHLQAVRRSVFGQSNLTTAPPNEVNASSTDNSSEVPSLQSGNDGPTEKESSFPRVQLDQRYCKTSKILIEKKKRILEEELYIYSHINCTLIYFPFSI